MIACVEMSDTPERTAAVDQIITLSIMKTRMRMRRKRKKRITMVRKSREKTKEINGK